MSEDPAIRETLNKATPCQWCKRPVVLAVVAELGDIHAFDAAPELALAPTKNTVLWALPAHVCPKQKTKVLKAPGKVHFFPDRSTIPSS